MKQKFVQRLLKLFKKKKQPEVKESEYMFITFTERCLNGLYYYSMPQHITVKASSFEEAKRKATELSTRKEIHKLIDRILQPNKSGNVIENGS